MDHSSAIISCVANLSISNPLSICNPNYRQILNECNNKCDMFANYICRAWLSNLSNATMANVNILSEIIEIRTGFKRCQS